ncbi:MAG TPA: PD-(D/E)XK nuclease family protein [Ohtaekwangia sp.]
MPRQTFIQSIAGKIANEYPLWENLTVVFPNRRAALYFRRALTDQVTAPRWAPHIVSIEEFIGSFSDLQEADKLSLVVRLHEVYKKVTSSDENLDRFYFWGEMLLRDFEELDKYHVNAAGMFRDLSNQKELDQYFDYLTEEQKTFLMEFWQTLEFNTTDNKQRFLELWKSLSSVYDAFKKALRTEGIGYGGMIHRDVADHPELFSRSASSTQYVFAGFNALTVAEEKILSWFVEHRNARMFWDEDAYYVKVNYREAGSFLRQYRQHPVLGKTFPPEPESFLDQPRKITVLGVPQKAGQPKLLAEQLQEIVRDRPAVENTVIVLADESLLLPVMYALPKGVDVNVTMGYPLANTPYYSFIDFLFELHLHKRHDEFYHRYVLALLNHPYLKAKESDGVKHLREDILKRNQVYLSPAAFEGKGDILEVIFTLVPSDKFLPYIITIIEYMAVDGNDMMEKEFAFHFHRILSRIQEIASHIPMELRMQQRMFRQVVRSEKVPFSGEPLKGLQIMGVLETRNLDFDHVIILSLNEGLWPAAPKQGSYIPHNIRKAYGLPTSEHQDAMYAYLFYRLLQRAGEVDLYYNTEPDVLGMGEMSRYLYQVIYETKWPHERKILYNPVQVKKIDPIVIPKTASVLEKMEKFSGKPLFPSGLNMYLECRLKFYFRHVVEIKEPDEVEEEADARIFGNMVHKVMELFYQDIKPPAGPWEVRKEHFANKEVKLERLVERAFRLHFHFPETKKFVYEGGQLVVKEMVKLFVSQVLNQDEAYAPFTIELLEANNFNTSLTVQQKTNTVEISIGGKIDRVDRKGDVVRIMDYKTGKDDNAFDSVPGLFSRDLKRNKAAFQAMLYTWVYERLNASDTGSKLQPGLINRKESFREDFVYGLYMDKHRMDDARPYLSEFEGLLKALLSELYDPAQPFDQTPEEKNCMFCPYREICSR